MSAKHRSFLFFSITLILVLLFSPAPKLTSVTEGPMLSNLARTSPRGALTKGLCPFSRVQPLSLDLRQKTI